MVELVKGNIINFKTDKQLIYVKQLGSGGTGEVHLFYEELTDKKYAIKKFNPIPGNDNEDAFGRFVDEIKILVDLYHKNIVRVYTYYLFPDSESGYLQMEYIEGDTIDVYLENNPDKFDAIFAMAIDAFSYLESKGILHRDIRFNNLLVSNGELKVIDFGFGKKLTEENIRENSVMLNYPVTIMPEEISLKGWEYEEQTEIYFLGNVFKKLLADEKSIYTSIIDTMCEIKKEKRYQSFKQIKDDIMNKISLPDFSQDEKTIYLRFASSFISLITSFKTKPDLENSTEEIIHSLKKVYSDNALETKVQNNRNLINCFLASGKYVYNRTPSILVSSLKDFCSLISKAETKKQEIILNGIKNRMSAIKVELDEKLPF